VNEDLLDARYRRSYRESCLCVCITSGAIFKSCVVNKNINLALYSLRVCIYVDNTKYMLGFMLLMFLLVMMYISKDIITVLQYKRSDRLNSLFVADSASFYVKSSIQRRPYSVVL